MSLLGNWASAICQRAWGLGTKYTKMNQFLWIWIGQWLGLIALLSKPITAYMTSISYSQSLVEYLKPKSLVFFWFLANFSHCGYGKKIWKIRHILRGKRKKSQVSPYLDNEFLLLVVTTRQDSLIVWPLAKVGSILLWIQLLSGFSIHLSTFEGKV